MKITWSADEAEELTSFDLARIAKLEGSAIWRRDGLAVCGKNITVEEFLKMLANAPEKSNNAVAAERNGEFPAREVEK